MEKTIDPLYEIGEEVTITDRSQIMSITPEQANIIKSLRIENQLIDDDFITELIYHTDNLFSVYFVRCDFSGGGWYILSWIPTANEIGFVHCQLSVDSFDKLISALYPYNPTDILDLSGNKLGADPKRFVKSLCNNIFHFKSLGKLIIAENGFDKSIIPLINKESNNDVNEIIL